MSTNFQFGYFHCIALVSIYPLSLKIIRLITSITRTSGSGRYSPLVKLADPCNDGEYCHRLILQMGKLRLEENSQLTQVTYLVYGLMRIRRPVILILELWSYPYITYS